MPNIPSFRPRGNIGLVQGREVAPTQAFLRYLDQLRRVSDTDNAAILKNAQDILQNAAGINTNSGDIADLQDDVLANDDEIEALGNTVAALDDRISALEDNTRTPATTTYVENAPANPAATEYT